MAALYARLKAAFGPEVPGLLGFLLLVVVVFGLTAPNFMTAANFGSIAFQLPELGLLTLAMLIPIISGGFNLAIIYTANMAGLTLAYVLNLYGGVEAGVWPFVIGSMLAFDQFYLMTGGGPRGKTFTSVYWIYQSGFVRFDLGYSAALSVILMVVIMAMTVTQLRLQSRGRR